MSNNARKASTVGQMINIIAINAHSLVELAHYVNVAWSSMMSILIAVVLLSFELGFFSALAGTITIAVFIPVNTYITNKSKVLQKNKLTQTDSRIKMTNEMLNGIKVSILL